MLKVSRIGKGKRRKKICCFVIIIISYICWRWLYMTYVYIPLVISIRSNFLRLSNNNYKNDGVGMVCHIVVIHTHALNITLNVSRNLIIIFEQTNHFIIFNEFETNARDTEDKHLSSKFRYDSVTYLYICWLFNNNSFITWAQWNHWSMSWVFYYISKHK